LESLAGSHPNNDVMVMLPEPVVADIPAMTKLTPHKVSYTIANLRT